MQERSEATQVYTRTYLAMAFYRCSGGVVRLELVKNLCAVGIRRSLFVI